jgi:hypothetical protein
MIETPKTLDAAEYADAPQAASLELRGMARRLARWGLVIAEFGAVQMAVQALLAVSGLLIVRMLSKQEYALFAVANSMQTTCNLLADIGVGVGVRAIGGRVWGDRHRFGQLLNTALGLRRNFAAIAIAVCVPVAAWMLRRNGAGIAEIIGLCVAIMAGVIPLLGSSVWAASPLLHGEYRRIQKLDLGNAALRLTLMGACAIQRINAFLAVMVGVAGNWIQSLLLRRWARDHADPAAPVNREDRAALLGLSVQSLPNTLFFCFQGQVTLLILTLVGNPTGIADVTALGRVASLFAVFSMTFANVLAPRFARCQEAERMRQLYALLVSATALALLPLLFFAWFLPDPFLWLLGGKYQHLGRECGWVVTAGCVGQLGGVMWALNSGKAWIRFQATGFIPVILSAQVGAAFFLNLRQFHDVLIFNVVTAAAPLLLYALDAYFGLRGKSSREQGAWSREYGAKIKDLRVDRKDRGAEKNDELP